MIFLSTGNAEAAPLVNFYIPAGSLARALTRFALQADRQLLFSPELVAGRRVPGIAGPLDPDRALDRLLAGSGLVARRGRGGLFLIETEAAVPAHPSIVPSPGGARTADDIVVTALKRESLLRLTAVSMSAERGTSLSPRGTLDLEGLSRTMPELLSSISGTSQQRLAMRGVYGTGEATVGVYYDETPVNGPAGTTFDPGSVAPDIDLVDVDRVELLRGPQGSLYGASSMGGTLRVLFNQPDPGGWGGEAAAGLDLVSHGRAGGIVSGVVNAPIAADVLAVRGSIYRRRTAGYIDNPRFGLRDVGQVIREGERIAAGWTPHPDVRIMASAMWQRLHADDAGFWNLGGPRYRSNQPTRTPYGSDLGIYNLTLRWNIGPTTLTATGSTYAWDMIRQMDYTAVLAQQRTSLAGCARFAGLAANIDCTAEQRAEYAAYVDSHLPAILYQPMRITSDTAEFRLASNGDGSFSWTVGAFLEQRKDRTESYALRADASDGEIVRPFDIIGLRTIRTRLGQRALFGEITGSIVPGMTATVGARYFRYRRSASGAVPIANAITGTGALSDAAYATKEGGANLKVQLAYRPSSDVLAYLQAAEGFRPGGVNITPALSDAERRYRADRLWSYELGSKIRLNGGAIALDAALYHIDWVDMISAFSSASGAFVYNANIGSADIGGAEIQIAARLPAAELSAKLGYVDARLAEDQAVPSAAGAGRSGDRLPYVPHLSMVLGGVHRIRLAPNIAASLRGDISHVGASASQFNREIAYYQRTPARTFVNVEAAVIWQEWQATLAIRNLFDAIAARRIMSSAFGSERVYSSSPRTLSLKIFRRFR
ncbi:TonB-dependent receptor domain-containing protein [Sphingomonas oleivorans]|uniref:TonB-dependent receptor domain-containing protein n=1 Tax=Sphingomonas oleivorans TaxID=1735121 RepID=UPI0013FE210D|nr:TonB-dependent receptor [Sphingomonas oleivorans]